MNVEKEAEFRVEEAWGVEKSMIRSSISRRDSVRMDGCISAFHRQQSSASASFDAGPIREATATNVPSPRPPKDRPP